MSQCTSRWGGRADPAPSEGDRGGRGPRQAAAVYPARDFVEAEELIAYGVNYPDLDRALARLIDKIFRGARPGDLPVEQPTRFELVVNLKTARALGVDIRPRSSPSPRGDRVRRRTFMAGLLLI